MLTDDDIDAYIAHFGVKGMRWGVRNAGDSSSGGSPKQPVDHSVRNHRLKVAGIVVGSVAGAALVAGGTYYLAKNGKLPISALSSSHAEAGKKLVEEFSKPAEELKGVVHITGSKYLADRTVSKGGLNSIVSEATKAGFANRFGTSDLAPGEMRRYEGKIAIAFLDHQGRRDFSGRPIVHQIILPSHHAQGISTFEEAQKKAWSLVKDQYEKFWQYGLSKEATNSGAKALGLMD